MDAILDFTKNFAIEKKTRKTMSKEDYTFQQPTCILQHSEANIGGQKIWREEVCSLACRISHEIKP